VSWPSAPSSDRWDVIAPLSIFVAALAVRLLYLHQAGSLPSFEFPIVDARSYHEWALSIAAGDWLGDRVFYQAPAYPYFLATLYTIFGADLATAYVSQAVLGATSCVLIYVATRSLFGRSAAVVAGALLAGYAPAIFFGGMIQKTSLGLLLTSGLLVLLTRFAARPAAGSIAGAGALVGLLALTRENALSFAVLIPAWLLWRHRERRLAFALAFVLGVAVILVPVGFRNLAVGDTFAITTSQLGPNFYIGNNPHATGLYAPLLPGRHTPDFEGSDAKRAAEWEMKRALGADEVSRYWLGQSLDWIVAEPGAWLALLLRKTLLTLNDFEIPDTENIYVHAHFSWLLSSLHGLLRFGVLLPLALAGLVFAWRERAQQAPGSRGVSELIALLAFVFAMTAAAFYAWARYRFPLVPLIVPFAALGVVGSFELARLGEWRRMVAPSVALLLGALLSNLVLIDREAHSQAAWVNLGNIMLREQRYDEAEAYLERARAIDNESSDLYFHLAVLGFHQGRPEDTEHHLRRMLELEPTDFRGHRLLAQVLRAAGRKQEANYHLRESVRLEPERKRAGRPGAPRPDGGAAREAVP
jgi:4-amino-4-deoxy-L-arabinose transferase-like glycosyltransferase